MHNTGSINSIQGFMRLLCSFHRLCIKLRFTSPNHLELLHMFSGHFRNRLSIGPLDCTACLPAPCCESGAKRERLWHTFVSECKEESTLTGGTSTGRTREHNGKNLMSKCRVQQLITKELSIGTTGLSTSPPAHISQNPKNATVWSIRGIAVAHYLCQILNGPRK